MSTKDKYRVCNWNQYNKALKQRGSITLWINEETMAAWYQAPATKKPGRPHLYSDVAIMTMLSFKQLFRLPLRSCQGFVESLVQLLKLPIHVPCYTQVSRRQKNLALPKLPVIKGGIHLVIDSSGLKVFGESEWKVRQHGPSKRRTWRKIHIGVDENSLFIVTADLTKNDCSDDKKLPDLLDQYPGDIDQVSLDGAYDSHVVYQEIEEHGAVPAIPPQQNPKHKPKTLDTLKQPRDHVVYEVQQVGLKQWKKDSGYHRRSLAENAFFRYKQIFGERLMARSFENQRTEALLRCHLLNQLTALGMPISVPVV